MPYCKRSIRLRVVAALGAVAVAACDSSDGVDLGSEPWNLATGFIVVRVAASDEVTAKVFVSLSETHGGTRGVTQHLLPRGDVLTACVEAACRPMTIIDSDTLRSTSFVNSKTYFAELPFVAESPYTISLSRDGNNIAPSSVISLPVPLTILAPAPGVSATDGQQVAVQWSPPNGNSIVRGNAHCVHQGGLESERVAIFAARSPDTGMAIVSIDDMLGGSIVRPSPPPQTPVLRCDVVLEIEQVRVGTLASAYAGGNLSASFRRSVTIEYTPSQR